MGAQQDDTATTSLRLLNRYYRERPTTGAEGHSYIGNSPRATATSPGLPYNATVTELIDASAQEIAAHAHAVNPDAGPLPPVVDSIYDWYEENIKNADAMERQRGQVMLYRQHLEHAIAIGDTSVIRPHRCPACHTFGLMWREARQRVLCTNGRCRGRDGMSRTWTLGKLAYEHVAAEKMSRECAT